MLQVIDIPQMFGMFDATVLQHGTRKCGLQIYRFLHLGIPRWITHKDKFKHYRAGKYVSIHFSKQFDRIVYGNLFSLTVSIMCWSLYSSLSSANVAEEHRARGPSASQQNIHAGSPRSLA